MVPRPLQQQRVRVPQVMQMKYHAPIVAIMLGLLVAFGFIAIPAADSDDRNLGRRLIPLFKGLLVDFRLAKHPVFSHSAGPDLFLISHQQGDDTSPTPLGQARWLKVANPVFIQLELGQVKLTARRVYRKSNFSSRAGKVLTKRQRLQAIHGLHPNPRRNLPTLR